MISFYALWQTFKGNWMVPSTPFYHSIDDGYLSDSLMTAANENQLANILPSSDSPSGSRWMA